MTVMGQMRYSALHSTPCRRVWMTDSTRLAPRPRRRRLRRWLLNFGAINLDAEFCGMRTNCSKVNTKSAKQKSKKLKKNFVLWLCFPQSISVEAPAKPFSRMGHKKTQQFINGIPQFELKMRHFKYDFGSVWSAQEIGIGNAISF